MSLVMGALFFLSHQSGDNLSPASVFRGGASCYFGIMEYDPCQAAGRRLYSK